MNLCRRAANAIFVVAIFAGLTACAPMQSITAPEWESRRIELLALDNWSLRGRIAFKNGSEGGQAKLSWLQVIDSSQIRVAGPFGAGAYDLLWSPGLVSIAGANGAQSLQYQGAEAAENFLQDQLGWSFPAGSIRYWVLGIPDPNAPRQERFDADGALAAIEQHGWTINYERFAEVDGFVLPTKVVMERGSANLRIAISSWEIAAASD